MCANVTVTAESKRFTKSLAWFSATNQLKPDFLVEGDFYDTSVLSAESVQADRISDGDPAYAYIWNIDNMPEQKGRICPASSDPGRLQTALRSKDSDGK